MEYAETKSDEIDNQKSKATSTTENDQSLILQLVITAAVILILAAVNLLAPPTGLSRSGFQMIGIALVSALLWSTELVPIPITALLIIFLQGIFNILPFQESLASLAHPVNTLLFVGFVLAAGLQKFDLDRKISISFIKLAGTRVRRLLFAMMAIVAILSMWMSNTSTVALVVPIVISIIEVSKGEYPNLKRSFMIGIAYAGTIGGIATPVGTPPNPITIGFLSDMAGVNISFLDWIMIGLPFSLILLPVAWLVVILIYPPEIDEIEVPASALEMEINENNKWGVRRFLLIFMAIVVLWLAESFFALPDNWLYLVAVGGSITMCLPMIGVLSWEELSNEVNWGVLILIGGGLALGSGLSESGVISWIVNSFMAQIQHLPINLVIIVVAAMTSLSIMFFCSLTATSTAFVPLAITLALQLNADPLIFAAAAGIASSFAYILPANTPPNAISYSSGYFETKDMIFSGLILLALSILVFVLVSNFLWPVIL